MGSSLEIYPVPNRYTVRRFPEGLNDAQRLAMDWYLVGHALYTAIGSNPAESENVEEQPTAKR